MVSQTPDGIVEFSFYRPQASRMSLVGDFNGWNLDSFSMRNSGDGWWRCRLDLAPGSYQFRYRVDGEWCLDYVAFGLAPGPHGMNSVVRIGDSRARSESQPQWESEPEHKQSQAA